MSEELLAFFEAEGGGVAKGSVDLVVDLEHVGGIGEVVLGLVENQDGTWIFVLDAHICR